MTKTLLDAARRLTRRERARPECEPVEEPAIDEPLGSPPPIRDVHGAIPNEVDEYWSRHTVNSEPFKTRAESEEYLEWRFREYPLFREFSGLWGSHDGETILDYGCGPGNDLVGFGLYSQAERIIGVDVSHTALELAQQRIALHGIDPERYDLVLTSDAVPGLPVEDDSIDYLQSQGVLMCTSDPLAILHEFRRVLKPSGRAQVMVYNELSLWLHLYTAYERMIVIGDLDATDIRDAFQRNTDGPSARSRAPIRPRTSRTCAGRPGCRRSTWAGICPRRS